MITSRDLTRASFERFVESVLIYVILPASYSFCATAIVCATENPSFRKASCCRVEVVKGGAGDRVPGLMLILATEYSEPLHSSRNFKASFSSGNRFEASAFRTAFSSLDESIRNTAVTLKADSDSNEIISLSLSTSRRTATD